MRHTQTFVVGRGPDRLQVRVVDGNAFSQVGRDSCGPWRMRPSFDLFHTDAPIALLLTTMRDFRRCGCLLQKSLVKGWLARINPISTSMSSEAGGRPGSMSWRSTPSSSISRMRASTS